MPRLSHIGETRARRVDPGGLPNISRHPRALPGKNCPGVEVCPRGRDGVKVDIGILGSQPVPTIVRQVQLAESLGYDTAWITDTHLVCRELWVTLTACALGTSRIRLGPGIAVPHTRHIS